MGECRGLASLLAHGGGAQESEAHPAVEPCHYLAAELVTIDCVRELIAVLAIINYHDHLILAPASIVYGVAYLRSRHMRSSIQL